MLQTQTLGKYHFKKAGKSQTDVADANHKAAPQRSERLPKG